MKLCLNSLVNKYKKLPISLRAMIWFTICNFALKGLSFVCLPLYTRLLDSSEYGRMNILTSYDTIFVIFATFEVYLGAFQRGLLIYKNEIQLFESSVVLFSNILTTLCLVVFLLFHEPLTAFTHIPIVLYLIMTVNFWFTTPYNCWLNRKRFAYDYKAAVPITLLMAVVSNLLPLVILPIVGNTALVKVSSSLLLAALFACPFWFMDFRPSLLWKNTGKVREIFVFIIKFQGPLVFHSLSYFILGQSDRIMIEKFTDSSKVGYYSVAYSMAMVITLIQNSLNQVLKPWRYEKLEKKSYRDIRNISNVLILLIGTCIIIFILIVPEVFRFIFAPEYYEAIDIMPVVSISVFFLFLYTIFVDIESYYGKTNYIAVVSMISAGLNIALNFIGLNMFDYKVCAFTTLICYVIMSFLHYLLMLRTCKKANIDEMPVDSKMIVLLSIFALVVSLIINIFYSSFFFRYLLLVIIMILAFFFRKKLVGSIKTIMKKDK